MILPQSQKIHLLITSGLASDFEDSCHYRSLLALDHMDTQTKLPCSKIDEIFCGFSTNLIKIAYLIFHREHRSSRSEYFWSFDGEIFVFNKDGDFGSGDTAERSLCQNDHCWLDGVDVIRRAVSGFKELHSFVLCLYFLDLNLEDSGMDVCGSDIPAADLTKCCIIGNDGSCVFLFPDGEGLRCRVYGFYVRQDWTSEKLVKHWFMKKVCTSSRSKMQRDFECLLLSHSRREVVFSADIMNDDSMVKKFVNG